jgi:hypothetical protein
MLSTRQLDRSNNQPASYAALTQFAPEPLKAHPGEKKGSAGVQGDTSPSAESETNVTPPEREAEEARS